MFTGLVEEIGVVRQVKETPGTGEKTLTIQCSLVLEKVKLGDSIAVNGTCLTVTSFTAESFDVVASLETLRRTNLGQLVEGSRVNLERSMSVDARFGGHIVQGHVDATVELVDRRDDGQALWMTFQFSTDSWLSLVVQKGYVSLDGISLTVCSIDDFKRQFSIMLIPYTQTNVALSQKQVGELINFEADITGKYILRSLELQRIQAQK
ncbi:hypothetical protein MIR68_006612 [Amoeboaphelidium protococcarum]|nr:hypothetical protein MIR68_006612 [Amoeboaphelidium protococcarum]